jgi:hypothetical protein
MWPELNFTMPLLHAFGVLLPSTQQSPSAWHGGLAASSSQQRPRQAAAKHNLPGGTASHCLTHNLHLTHLPSPHQLACPARCRQCPSSPDPLPLCTAADADKSRFFGGIAPDLKQKLSDPTLNIALENHMYGIPPTYFDRYPILRETFTIISTTKDRNGTEYVSTVEHKKYPFTGALVLMFYGSRAVVGKHAWCGVSLD